MRLLRPLAAYLQGVESTVAALCGADVESYVEELLTPGRANLRIRVRFANGRLLEVNEAVAVLAETLCHLDYRYHCQGPDNKLVFRYDNTPHFPELPGFPHHKHLPGKTVPAPRPPIAEVIADAITGPSR